jgi:hypothetical protein
MRPVLDWVFIIGSGIGVPLMFAAVAFLRRKPRTPAPAPAPRALSGTAAGFKVQSREELRDVPRRGGHPVSVTIECYSGRISGWVIDRSLRGIGIQTERAVPPGEVVKIRPAEAGPVVAFEKAQVRHCTPSGQEFHIGCEFFRTPGSDFMIHLG